MIPITADSTIFTLSSSFFHPHPLQTLFLGQENYIYSFISVYPHPLWLPNWNPFEVLLNSLQLLIEEHPMTVEHNHVCWDLYVIFHPQWEWAQVNTILS